VARKEKLMNLLVEAAKREKEFVDTFTAGERAASGTSDNWSAKDLIAHCAFWKQRRVAEIPLVLQGGTPILFDDFDHENDRIFQEHCDLSWEEVMALSYSALHLLIMQLQGMSEADLNHPWQDDRPIWRTVVGNGYSHPMTHMAEHYQQKGDMARADELTVLLRQPLAELDAGPDWQGTVMYNTACRLSLLGEKEAAIAELRDALALMPALVEWSQQDSDLDPLREEAAFQALYED